MSRVRDLASILTASSDIATDAEVTSSIASHAAAADPHTVYLKESEYNAAGKNVILNGAFDIWQRGTSITCATASTVYTADRFYVYSVHSAGTATFTQQTFTPGSAPVAGYEGTFFGRLTCGSTTTYAEIGQKIENVRTFTNQVVTVSFWAKASVNTTLSGSIFQDFGSGAGGSTGVYNNFPNNLTVTTSWQRFVVNVTVPSVSGKTIAAGNNFRFQISFAPASSQTFDIWGVQVEAGSVATPFMTATGNIQAELAACQRYCYRRTTGSGGYGMATITAYGANDGYARIDLPVRMRTTPSATLSGTASHYRAYINNLVNLTQISLQEANTDFALFSVTVTGNGLYGVGAAGWLASDASSNGYIQLNAEL